jgi:hypothetical protein
MSHTLADFHNILDRQKNYFCQLLKVHGVKDVRQTEMDVAEPLVTHIVLLRLMVKLLEES